MRDWTDMWHGQMVADLEELGLMDPCISPPCGGHLRPLRKRVEPGFRTVVLQMKSMAARGTTAGETAPNRVVPENQRKFCSIGLKIFATGASRGNFGGGTASPSGIAARAGRWSGDGFARGACRRHARAAGVPRVYACGSEKLTPISMSWIPGSARPVAVFDVGWPDDTPICGPTSHQLDDQWIRHSVLLGRAHDHGGLHLTMNLRPLSERVPFRILYLHAIVRDRGRD